MALVASPRDVTTLVAWGRLAGCSRGALRAWCYAAHLTPRTSLSFARLLRAVVVSQDGSWDPNNLLNIVDPRSRKRLLDQGGLPSKRNVQSNTVDQFFVRQRLVSDVSALHAVRTRLARDVGVDRASHTRRTRSSKESSMQMRWTVVVGAVVASLCFAGSAFAQDPQDPPPSATVVETDEQAITRLTQEKVKAELEKDLALAQQAKAEAELKTAEAALKLATGESSEGQAVLALEAEKTRAETEKAIAEAERDALKAGLPTSETKPLEGTATADGVTIEPTILAHGALTGIATRIAGELKPLSLTKLIIHDEKTLNHQLQYAATMKQIATLTTRYAAQFTNPTPTPPDPSEDARTYSTLPTVATALATSVIDFVSLFRTNVDVKGVAVTLLEMGLVAELAQAIQDGQSSTKVIYPSVYLPADMSGQLVTQLQALTAFRARADGAIAVFSRKTKDQQKADPLRVQVEMLKRLGSETDRLFTDLTTTDATTGLTGLGTLVKAEVLKGHLDQSNSHVLLLRVLAAGGNNRSTRNLFTGGSLTHSGGAVVSYILFDTNGLVLRSGMLHEYSPYTKAKDMVTAPN